MKVSISDNWKMQLNPDLGEMYLLLVRLKDNGVQTIGHLYVMMENTVMFQANALERPWKDNKRNISCIKGGIYGLKKYSSPKYPNVYEITGVPDRDLILIHNANYYTEIEGCVAVGSSFVDINKDGEVDVVNSVDTLEALMATTEGAEMPIVIVDI